MGRAKTGRTILGVIAGYLANAILVGVTEAAYVKWLDTRKYFVVDLMTQVVATIIGGCVSCFIGQGGERIAAISLTLLGFIIGTASLVTSWNVEPHWYGIALLFVYAPCVWTGYALVVRHEK